MHPFPVGLLSSSAPSENVIFKDLFNGSAASTLSGRSGDIGGAWASSHTRLFSANLDARSAFYGVAECVLDGSGSWRWENHGEAGANSNTLILHPGAITTTNVAMELVLGVDTADDSTVIGMAARCNNSALSTRFDGAGVKVFLNSGTANMTPQGSSSGGSFTTNTPTAGTISASYTTGDITIRVEITGTGASSQCLYYFNGVLAWTGIGTALQGTGDVRLGFHNQSSSLPTGGRPLFRSYKVVAL